MRNWIWVNFVNNWAILSIEFSVYYTFYISAINEEDWGDFETISIYQFYHFIEIILHIRIKRLKQNYGK